MKHLNILHLISSRGFYGAENVIVELGKALSTSQFHVTIGVFQNIHNQHMEIAEIAKQNSLNVAEFICKGQIDRNCLRQIQTFIKKNNIHIVHSHGYKSNFYALLAAWFEKKSTVTTCHLWTGESLKNIFYETLDKMWIKKFSQIVTVSDLLTDEVLKHGVKKEKVTTIYNGIDIKRFNGDFDSAALREHFGILPHCKVIGTIGRLSQQKGHIFLLEMIPDIIQQFPDIVLLIVGEGDLKDGLIKKAKDLHIYNKVLFTGARDDIPNILNLLDIFVLPSLSEGLPMVMLEAMAAGKPVIATHVGAIQKVLQNQANGILIESRDWNGFSNAILELLNDQGKAARIASNAKSTVAAKYSSTIMAKKYMGVYERLFPE